MPLRGSWGGEGIPCPKGEIGESLGGQRIKRECGQVSPAHLDPQEPAEIPGLILCPLRRSSCKGPEGGRGREGGAKIKAGPLGSAPLRGGWGRGGVPVPSGTHPWLRVQQ